MRQTQGSQKPRRQRVQVRVLPGVLVERTLRKLNRIERRPPKPEDEGSSPSRNAEVKAMSSESSSSSSGSAETEGLPNW